MHVLKPLVFLHGDRYDRRLLHQRVGGGEVGQPLLLKLDVDASGERRQRELDHIARRCIAQGLGQLWPGLLEVLAVLIVHHRSVRLR